MAIDEVLSRISAIQARFGFSVGGTAEFDGLVSDAARHAGLGVDETSEDERSGESTGSTDASTSSGDLTAGESATPTDASVEVAGIESSSSGGTLDALVAAQLRAAATGGSSTLLELAADSSDSSEPLELLASYIAQQQAGIGLDSLGGT